MREGRMRWYGHVMRPRVCKTKDDGNKVTGKEEKRKTKEKIFKCCERRYGGSWCKGDGRLRQDTLEKDDTSSYH